MKEYQDLLGKLAIAAAIVIAALLLSDAIESAGGNIGSQIAGALSLLAANV